MNQELPNCGHFSTWWDRPGLWKCESCGAIQIVYQATYTVLDNHVTVRFHDVPVRAVGRDTREVSARAQDALEDWLEVGLDQNETPAQPTVGYKYTNPGTWSAMHKVPPSLSQRLISKWGW